MEKVAGNIVSSVFDDLLSGASAKRNVEIRGAAGATGKNRANIRNNTLVLRVVKDADDDVRDNVGAFCGQRAQWVEARNLFFHCNGKRSKIKWLKRFNRGDDCGFDAVMKVAKVDEFA